LKILILHRKDISNPEAGGGTLYVHNVAKFLARKGHEVTLICAGRSGMGQEDNVDGVKIVRMGTSYSVYFHALISYFRRFRKNTDIIIDVINGPPWFSPLYSRTRKIALIFQTFKEVFSLELSKPIALVLGLIEGVIPYVYRKVSIITLSESVENELVDLGLQRNNIFIVPPGIEREKYKPRRKSPFPIVLYVGRLKKYKGLEHLIVAMTYVVKEIHDSKLIIAGKGDFETELRDFVDKMGLRKSVEFCGYVSEERKVELMQEAHVIVIPSVKEGWGIPIIEAAACGTPAIGTDTTGLRDSIIDGKTGFLVPYKKPRILARKIVKILQDDELRNKLSKNAIEWADNFDWNTRLLKFEEIIEAAEGENKLCE
jgi:glycosyltransferase involved in cell wall biosynthesis